MTRDDSSQHALPIRPEMQAIDPALIYQQPSMTRALLLCQSLSGKEDKHFLGATGVVKDQAQWSRIMGASPHNFPHDKLNLFMDLAGNEAPLMWLAHSRGYDITNLKHVETEMERRLRVANERAEKAELKVRVLTEALTGKVTA